MSYGLFKFFTSAQWENRGGLGSDPLSCFYPPYPFTRIWRSGIFKNFCSIYSHFLSIAFQSQGRGVILPYFTLFWQNWQYWRCHKSENIEMCYYVLGLLLDIAKISTLMHLEYPKSDANRRPSVWKFTVFWLIHNVS